MPTTIYVTGHGDAGSLEDWMISAVMRRRIVSLSCPVPPVSSFKQQPDTSMPPVPSARLAA